MIALTIIGILAAIALPAYFTFVQNTRAAQAVADLQAMRAAVYLYYGDLGRWPREAVAGQIPVGVGQNLPKNFTFRSPHYTLDYDNWVPLHRQGKAPTGTTTAIGVSLISRDPRFLERVGRLLRDAKFSKISRTKYTLEIATLDGF
jgi:type II secretory pathway pseudopilin PulG